MQALLVLILFLVCQPLQLLAQQLTSFHTSTDWEIKPSLKFDTLCALNFLAGDPYYLEY